MKKKLFLVCQAKGGCGKSVLTWLMAQKYPKAVYLDMDDGTTTMKQLKYLEPKMVTFLNAAKTIDRGMLNDFLEYVAGHEKDMFVCDLGASLSEQLPYYLQDNGADVIRQGLDSLGIEMTILCVIGGQNIFVACMNYLESLLSACSGKIGFKVAINDHFILSEVQTEEFNAFAKAIKIKESFHYNLSKDKNLTAQQKVNDVLKDGNGLKNQSVFTKILFDNAIKSLPL